MRQSSGTLRCRNAITGNKRIFSSSYEIHKLYINLFIWRTKTQLSSVCCLSLQDWTCFWTLPRRTPSTWRDLILRVYSALCNQTVLNFIDEAIKGQIITNRAAGQDGYNYSLPPTGFTSGRCTRFMLWNINCSLCMCKLEEYWQITHLCIHEFVFPRLYTDVSEVCISTMFKGQNWLREALKIWGCSVSFCAAYKKRILLVKSSTWSLFVRENSQIYLLFGN